MPAARMRSLQIVIAGLLLSIAGRTVHDVQEFGALAPDWPVTVVLVPVVLAVGWWRHPIIARWFLVGWLLLNALGGLLSVLPLPFWPYDPAQDAAHYGVHLVYALAQVPLLVWLVRQKGESRPNA